MVRDLDLAGFVIGFPQENGWGELRLGTVATYMVTVLTHNTRHTTSAIIKSYMPTQSDRKQSNHMQTMTFSSWNSRTSA